MRLTVQFTQAQPNASSKVSCALKITILLVAGWIWGGRTLGTAGNSEFGDAAYDAKDILRVELLEAFLAPRDLEDSQSRTARCEDLLFAVSQEVARNGILSRRRLFHRQGVQGHGREARHDGRRRALAQVLSSRRCGVVHTIFVLDVEEL